MRFNFLRIYFPIENQSKPYISISVITALDLKNINQRWCDGKTLSIHSQPKTLKTYAPVRECCREISDPSIILQLQYPSLYLHLNRYDLPLHSPTFVRLWTWKCHPFLGWRSTDTQVCFEKSAKVPSIYYPPPCQTVDACVGVWFTLLPTSRWQS